MYGPFIHINEQGEKKGDNNLMKICRDECCTGCTACMNVCPKKCITMVEDEIGHFFPRIDNTICINCGACKKICPSINSSKINSPINTYAAISNDNKDYMTSSSGGVASVLARHIIKNKGVVYGCTGTNGYDICHIRIDNEDDLWKLKGSKYVESRLDNIFKLVKKDVDDGKIVLFIGTPCQIAGANSLFGSKKNFYTVDLICHGVPPQRLLKEHLQEVTKVIPDEVKFRDGSKFALSLVKNHKTIFKNSNLLNLYYIGFNKTLFFRESCYNCIYATGERCGDITLGDFWGIKSTNIKADNGLSVLMVNTDKGKNLFEDCKDKLIFEEHETAEAVSGNAHLRHPSFKHKNTDKFRKMYPKMGFKKATSKCLMINRIKYLILIYSDYLFLNNQLPYYILSYYYQKNLKTLYYQKN